MKRILAILLAAVLTLGMTVTAFAAPSQSGDQTSGLIKSATGVETDEIEFTVGDFSFSNADVLAAAKNLGIDAAEVGVVGDLHMKSGKPFTGSATITFDVADVVAVLHYGANGWELVGRSATATFENGFSPVAILTKAKGSQNTGNDDKNQSGQKSSTTKSPQTGETPFVAIMILVAAMAAAGVVISRKKISDR